MLAFLQAANRKTGAPVSARQLVSAIEAMGGPDELGCRDSAELAQAVGRDLYHLWTVGTIRCAGKDNKAHLYACPTTLPGIAALLQPGQGSRRKRVLSYVRTAQLKLGRPVRLCDVVDAARDAGEILTPKTLSTDLSNLARGRHLRTAGSVRGAGGSKLYELAEAFAAPKKTPSLTWVETVKEAFAELWKERESEAAGRDARPVPIAAREIRHHLEAKYPSEGEEHTATNVTFALVTLGRGRSPVLRHISGSRTLDTRWVPAGVMNDCLDLTGQDAAACVHDSERLALLLDRIEEQTGKPAANSRELRAEMLKDSGISLIARSLTKAIDATCPRSGPGHSDIRRGDARILRAGMVGCTPYYCLPSKRDEATAYIEWLQSKLEWRRLDAARLVQQAQDCILPAVKAAQINLVLKNCQRLLSVLNQQAGDVILPEDIRVAARLLAEDVSKVLDEHHDTSNKLQFQHDPKTASPATWEPKELASAVARLSGEGKPEETEKVIHRLRPLLQPVRNPASDPSATTPRRSLPQHFDRTSALLVLATRYGGRTCTVQAELAANELRVIRHAEPAMASLQSHHPDHRLSAVACLAFLQDERGTQLLPSLVQNDAEPGIREAALWAYGFSDGEDAMALASRAAQANSSEQVRRFALHVLDTITDPMGWWKI